ncbi:hypothetical protein ACS0TY_003535 [Phlomoides rotata]
MVLASAGDDGRVSLWKKNGQSLWTVPTKNDWGGVNEVGTTSSIVVDPLPALGKISSDRRALIQSFSTNPEYLMNKIF